MGSLNGLLELPIGFATHLHSTLIRLVEIHIGAGTMRDVGVGPVIVDIEQPTLGQAQVIDAEPSAYEIEVFIGKIDRPAHGIQRAPRPLGMGAGATTHDNMKRAAGRHLYQPLDVYIECMPVFRSRVSETSLRTVPSSWRINEGFHHDLARCLGNGVGYQYFGLFGSAPHGKRTRIKIHIAKLQGAIGRLNHGVGAEVVVVAPIIIRKCGWGLYTGYGVSKRTVE